MNTASLTHAIDWVRLNIGGASKRDESLTEHGGLLRKDNVQWVCGLVRKIACGKVFEFSFGYNSFLQNLFVR
jgi:hypothetical protein